MASLTKLVSSLPRNSSETFLLGERDSLGVMPNEFAKQKGLWWVPWQGRNELRETSHETITSSCHFIVKLDKWILFKMARTTISVVSLISIVVYQSLQQTRRQKAIPWDAWDWERSIKGWFSLSHKHSISITSENTRDISVSISRNTRRTNPLICLMLFSLAHKHKHKQVQ